MSKVYSKLVKRYKEIREESLMFKSQKSFYRFVSSHLSDKKESITLQQWQAMKMKYFTKNFSESTVKTKSHVQSIYSTLNSKHTVNIDYR